LPNYSDQDAREAERIVDRLLAPEQKALDLERGVVVSDLESDAAEFAEELHLLEEFGVDAPAVRIEEELIPVALWLVAGLTWPFFPSRTGALGHPWRDNPFFREWAYFSLRSLFETEARVRGFETLSRGDARATFVRRATDFLATRIAAVHEFDCPRSRRWSSISSLNVFQRAGGPRVSTPGCHFTVSTDSNGLRVFWSGPYRLSPNYFSHPTTPTIGVLQSGTYVFGVDGGAYGNQLQWDLHAVVTLPGSRYAHLNY
jgi:hypothetical protein